MLPRRAGVVRKAELEQILATPIALAAIVGALTGALGAALTAVINAISSHRREQRSRLFSERKLTYAAYLREIRHLEQMSIHGGVDDPAVAGYQDSALSQLEIIASARVRALHEDVLRCVGGLVDARRALVERLSEEEAMRSNEAPIKDHEFTRAHNTYRRAISRMEAAMRRDLGAS